MSFKFYDKVAGKFGGYKTKARYTQEFPTGEPEKVFREKLLELARKDKRALDVGCADGRFTLSIAPYFKEVVAIDLSSGMLEAARKLQRGQGVKNVSFEGVDAYNTPYEDASFDLVYSRRGPSRFTEIHRLLKPGGYFVEIEIGEKDTKELKEVFGRGQGFEEWNKPRVEESERKLEDAGFDVLYAEEFLYNEYYQSYEDLDLFLQGVPIFEDFDSEKDSKLLKAYAEKFETGKGIRLSRHRVVTVAGRPKEEIVHREKF